MKTDKKEGKSIIDPLALEQLAKRVALIFEDYSLLKLLKLLGVSNKLLIETNPKWQMLDKIFLTLATSKNVKSQRQLIAILEKSCDPVNFGGDGRKGLIMQDEFSSFLLPDGYCFDKSKIIKASHYMLITATARANIHQQRKRKAQDALIQESFSRSVPKEVLATSVLKIPKAARYTEKDKQEKIWLASGDIEIEKNTFNYKIAGKEFYFDDLESDGKKAIIVLYVLILNPLGFLDAESFLKIYRETKVKKLQRGKVTDENSLLSHARRFLKKNGSKCSISSIPKNAKIQLLSE